MTISLNQGMRSAEQEILAKLNKVPSLIYEELNTGWEVGTTKDLPAMDDYCLFAVWIQGDNIPIVVFSYRNSVHFKGGSALITTAPQGYIYGIHGIRNGTEITINFSGYQNVSTHAVTQKNIVRIWGII